MMLLFTSHGGECNIHSASSVISNKINVKKICHKSYRGLACTTIVLPVVLPVVSCLTRIDIYELLQYA